MCGIENIASSSRVGKRFSLGKSIRTSLISGRMGLEPVTGVLVNLVCVDGGVTTEQNLQCGEVERTKHRVRGG